MRTARCGMRGWWYLCGSTTIRGTRRLWYLCRTRTARCGMTGCRHQPQRGMPDPDRQAILTRAKSLSHQLSERNTRRAPRLMQLITQVDARTFAHATRLPHIPHIYARLLRLRATRLRTERRLHCIVWVVCVCGLVLRACACWVAWSLGAGLCCRVRSFAGGGVLGLLSARRIGAVGLPACGWCLWVARGLRGFGGAYVGGGVRRRSRRVACQALLAAKRCGGPGCVYLPRSLARFRAVSSLPMGAAPCS